MLPGNRGRLDVGGLLLLALASTACEKPARPETAAAGESCRERLAEVTPTFDDPLPISLPISRLVLTAQVTESHLVGELDRRIPKTLAKAKDRRVGAAGRASYTVTRGKPQVEAGRSGVDVMVPVQARIEMCKPFAGVCVTYGKCRPELETHMVLPLTLTNDLRLERARGSVKATRGCRIGIDVTPIVLSEARKALADTELRVNAELPDTRGHLQEAWSALQRPVHVDESDCARMNPDMWIYGPARQGEGVMSIALGLVGKVEPTKDCLTPGEKPARSAEFQRDVSPTSLLHVPRRLSLEEVTRGLTASLLGKVDETQSIANVEVVPTKDGHVGLGLTLEGVICGRAWLTARVEYDAATGELTLQEVRRYRRDGEFTPPEDSNEPLPADPLVAYVTNLGRMPVRVDIAGLTAQLRGFVRETSDAFPEDVHVNVALTPLGGAPALVGAKEIVVIAPVEGQAVLRAGKRTSSDGVP